MDNLQPPTDNLYKFLAIGGLAFALVAFIFLMREQAKQRERWLDAQVELATGGYQAGSGVPTDAALRAPFFRQQAALAETDGIWKLVPILGRTIGISISISIVGFAAWWFRVQRHEDAILKLTRAKLALELKSNE